MKNQTKNPGEVDKIIFFLKIRWLNDQAKKTFSSTSTVFNGLLLCYFPVTRKMGSAVVALSYWMSQRGKVTFLEKLFTRVLIDS